MGNQRRSGQAGWRTVTGTVALGALFAGWAGGLIPSVYAISYSVLSATAFMLYAHDKRAAQAGTMRTREQTLHLLDLLGGWPGGLVAQGWLRHKTRKTAFQLVFWATAALNCGVLAWLLSIGYLA